MKHPLFGYEVYRPSEVASILGVSNTSITALSQSGTIKAHQQGKRFLIPASELTRLAAQAQQFYQPQQNSDSHELSTATEPVEALEPDDIPQIHETSEPQVPTDNQHSAAEIRALFDMANLAKDDFARLLKDPAIGYDGLLLRATEEARVMKSRAATMVTRF